MKKMLNKSLCFVLSMAMLLSSLSVPALAEEIVSEDNGVTVNNEWPSQEVIEDYDETSANYTADQVSDSEKPSDVVIDSGLTLEEAADDAENNEMADSNAAVIDNNSFEVEESVDDNESVTDTENENESENDEYNEFTVTIEQVSEGWAQGPGNDDKVYTNQEELNQAIRDAYVNRETGVGKTVTFKISGNLTYNRDVVFDFLSEREGMKANEGDYLNFTSGHPTNEVFEYTDCTEYSGEKLEISTQFITNKEQENAVDSKVNSLLSSGGALYSASQSGSNETKARAAFNWIREHVASSTGNRKTPIFHTAYSAFINGHATCQGYALAYYRLVREMGVPCKIIMGTDANAHTYTITMMDDGYYYYVDPSQGIFKKDYNSFSRTTEQDKFRGSKYVTNYISKIKGYNSGPVEGKVALYRRDRETGEETLLVLKDTLLDIRQAVYADFEKQLNEESDKPNYHPDFNYDYYNYDDDYIVKFTDFDSYRIVLRSDVSSKSKDDLSFLEFKVDYQRADVYTRGTDISPLVDIDLNGYSINTAKSSDLFIYANSVSNGTINMASGTSVYLEASSENIDNNKPTEYSNIKFKGADGGKTGYSNVDSLILGGGVRIKDDCTITGIPCVNMAGGTIDCDFDTVHLYIHDCTNLIMSRDNVSLNGSINTQYLYIYGCNDFFYSDVKRSDSGYGFENPVAVSINNLNVTKGAKISECNELKIYGNVNLNTLVKVTDYDYWDSDYKMDIMNPNGISTSQIIQTKIAPLTVKLMSVKDASGVEVSRGSLNMSGTLDIYQLGNGVTPVDPYYEEGWGYRYPYTGHYAALPAMDILPVSVDASGYETEESFGRGDVVGNFNMSGIKYPSKNKEVITTENLENYINVVGVAGIESNPEIAYGQLIMSAPSKTLTFDANGGVTPEESRRIYSGKTYGVLPVPTRARQEFIGWYTEREGGTMVTAATNTPENDEDLVDVTLYAHWEKTQKAVAPVITIMKSSGYTNAAGEWSDGTKVQITDEIEGAEIWYTLDGSEPAKNGVSSRKISSDGSNDVIILSETGENVGRESVPGGDDRLYYNIKAKAFHDDYIDSDAVNLKVYVINSENDWGDIDENDRFAVPEGETVKSVLGDKINSLWVAFDNKVIDTDGYALFDYTGKAITPKIRIYHGTKLLKEKTDYTLKYANNTNAAAHNATNPKNGKITAPTITVTPKGNYAGAAFSVYFSIKPLNISVSDEYTSSDVLLIYKAGKTQKPSATLYKNGKKLGDKDYKVEWSTQAANEGSRGSLDYGTIPVEEMCTINNPYWIRITGQGNYSGAIYQRFVIAEEEMNLGKIAISKIADQKYEDWCEEGTLNLKEGGVCPDIIDNITLNKKSLAHSEDIVLSYSANNAVGTAQVTVSAKLGSDYYIGSKTATFKITGYQMSKVSVSGLSSSYTYTGSPITPMDEIQGGVTVTPDNIAVTYKVSKDVTMPLERDVDYEVSYLKNVNAGSATAVLTGIGRFTGTLKKSFKISAFEIGKGSIDTLTNHISIGYVEPDAEDRSYYYVKGGVTPKITVKFYPEGINNPSNYVELVNGVDYTVKYSNNTNVAAYNATNSKGKSIAPTVTVTGKNTFKGSVYANFSIIPSNMGVATMTCVDKQANGKSNAYYSAPTVSVVNNSGKTVKLASGTDYEKTIKYTYVEDIIVTQNINKSIKSIVRKAGTEVDKNDIVPAGTRIRATITGKGNYSGNLSTIYRVFKNNISKVSFEVTEQIYTGNPITLTRGIIDKNTLAKTGDIVAYTGKKDSLDNFTQYIIVGYTNNISKGTATVTVQGIGEYGGTKDIKFKISPKK